MNARDWDALGDCYAEDFELIDHRALGLGAAARARTRSAGCYRSGPSVAPDVEIRFEALAGDDEHIALRFGGYGHAAEGGGAMEYVVLAVATLRDGRILRAELFDVDDEAAALARLAELTSG